MSNAFFYTIGIAFCCGIFARSVHVFGLIEILFLLIIALCLALLWCNRRLDFLAPPFLLSLAILCFSLGALCVEVHETKISPLEQYVGEKVQMEGVITREPDIRESSVHLYVELDGLSEMILVTTDRFLQFSYGERIMIEGELRIPEAFETDMGRVFDYRGYLKSKGVGYIITYAKVEKTGTVGGNRFIAQLLQSKAAFMQTLERSIPEPQVGLGEGLLLGVKRALGSELEETFRETGIIHIIVLSGYNVMIVADGLMRLLSVLFVPRVRLIIGIIGISAFALIVGLTATVVRASVMAILILIARATGRTYAIMRALLLAGIIMLLINPYLLVYDPGFQLSFLATLGLIVLAPFIESKLHRVPTLFQAREFVTATVTTQLFVLPLLLYQMGKASIVSVFVNVLVLPMVPVAMFCTFVAGMAGMVVQELGVLVGFMAHLALSYIILIAQFFGSLPFAAVSVPAFSFWIVVLAYACIAYGVVRIVQKSNDPLAGLQGVAENDFADWTIEEEIPNAFKKSKSTFPFR